MSQSGLNLFIPMELLINSLNALSLSEKQHLWRILDEAIADAEEDDWVVWVMLGFIVST